LKAWEIWTWDGHPCILLSNQDRIERKEKLVVLKGQTLYSGDPKPAPLEIVLDSTDGLDFLWTAPKAELTRTRGTVTPERRRAIGAAIIRVLGLWLPWKSLMLWPRTVAPGHSQS
jgi:hypothetical protein